jgi:chromosome segregation ATPase
MACGFMKNVVRFGVIGALVVGAGIAIAGPQRVKALFHQARHNINAKIDCNITDPVALRSQLRDLESQYPRRIEEVRADLAELREQMAQLQREKDVDERVVAMADADLTKLASALEQAEDMAIQTVSDEGVSHQVVIVFKGDRLPVDAAYAKQAEVTNTRNAYSSRAADIERDLGYLAQQEERLTSLLSKLETERQTFQAQLWELDRKVDAVARNDRMIEIMAKRQRTIDEQSRYRAASLDQINGRLADIKAKQEAKLASLATEQARTSYEDAAKAEIDREMSSRKLSEVRVTPRPVRTKVIEIRPKNTEQAAPSEAEDGKLVAK